MREQVSHRDSQLEDLNMRTGLKYSFFALALALLSQSLPLVHAQTAPAAPSLQEQLEAQYPLAKLTSAGGCTVTNPETAMALQQGGIGALPQKTSSAACAAHYRNGRITKTGFKCNYWLEMTKQALVALQKGDKVFPTKIETAKDDIKISFGYCSGDPGQAALYTGQVVVEFPKDSLKGLSVTQVEDKLAEVFTPDSGDQQQAQGGPGPAQQAEEQAQPAGNGTASSACNVQVGQTVDQVLAACGQPSNQLKGAGAKQLFFYKDPKLKVTIVNGKVADID